MRISPQQTDGFVATDSLPIFLIGPRGSGKTCIGKMLARKLERRFYDTDAIVVAEAGRSIAEIVAEEGWESFRAREARALAVAAVPGSVVATGGGMVLAEANRNFMRETGLVLYLAAPAPVLYDRLTRERNTAQRPPLTQGDLLREITSVLEERGHVYRGTAHGSVDASAEPAYVLRAMLRMVTRLEHGRRERQRL